jgi:hypothetical protein
MGISMKQQKKAFVVEVRRPRRIRKPQIVQAKVLHRRGDGDQSKAVPEASGV